MEPQSSVLEKSSITPSMSIRVILLVQVSTTEHIRPEALFVNLNPEMTLCVIALLVEAA